MRQGPESIHRRVSLAIALPTRRQHLDSWQSCIDGLEWKTGYLTYGNIVLHKFWGDQSKFKTRAGILYTSKIHFMILILIDCLTLR